MIIMSKKGECRTGMMIIIVMKLSFQDGRRDFKHQQKLTQASIEPADKFSRSLLPLLILNILARPSLRHQLHFYGLYVRLWSCTLVPGYLIYAVCEIQGNPHISLTVSGIYTSRHLGH